MRIYKVYSDHEQRYCLTGLDAYYEAIRLRDATGEDIWCDHIDLGTLSQKELREVYEVLELTNKPTSYKSWPRASK